MTETREGPRSVVLKLNQQQLELIDRTLAHPALAGGIAANREELVRLALRDYAARRAEAGQ